MRDKGEAVATHSAMCFESWDPAKRQLKSKHGVATGGPQQCAWHMWVLMFAGNRAIGQSSPTDSYQGGHTSVSDVQAKPPVKGFGRGGRLLISVVFCIFQGQSSHPFRKQPTCKETKSRKQMKRKFISNEQNDSLQHKTRGSDLILPG